MFSPYKITNHAGVCKAIVEGKNVYPVSCELDLSNYCNHNCVWCITGKFRKKEKEMIKLDKVLNIIQQLADAGVKSITLTGGGEPLTHPDVITVMHYIREKGMEVSLVTNGGLITKDIADSIIKTCSFVRISLDAGEEHTYSKTHRARNNTIKDILSWIKYFRDNSSDDFVIGTAYIVHPYNYREISTAAFLVKNAGASYLQIRPVFMRGMILTDTILTETYVQTQEAMKLETKTFNILPMLHRFTEFSSIDKNFEECMGHALLGVIAANGKMYLCCQLRGLDQWCIGDLYKNTFNEIWNGQLRKDVVRRINVNRCPPCRYTKYNEFLTYLKSKREHINFL